MSSAISRTNSHVTSYICDQSCTQLGRHSSISQLCRHAASHASMAAIMQQTMSANLYLEVLAIMP
jgi:hypothetical protein